MRKELIYLSLFAILIATMGIASSAVYYVVYNTPVELGSPDDGIYADGFFHLLRIWDIAPGQALAVPNTCSKLIDTQWTDLENQTIDEVPIGFDGACAALKIDEVQDMR